MGKKVHLVGDERWFLDSEGILFQPQVTYVNHIAL